MNDEQTVQHTDGLLRIDPDHPCDIQTADGSLEIAMLDYDVASDFPAPPIDVAKANGRRIVACWNACAGISTEALERLPVPFADALSQQFKDRMDQCGLLAARVAELEQQLNAEKAAAVRERDRFRDAAAMRNRLLAAAETAKEEMCNTVAPRTSFTDAVDALDAAITAAGGASLLQNQAE